MLRTEATPFVIRRALGIVLLLALACGTGQRSDAAPPPAETLHVYFGNLHSHTSYSDGSGTPEQAYRHARDVGHLDFLAITEHNHAKAENGIDSGDPRRDGVLIATSPQLYDGRQPGGGTLAQALIPTAGRFTVDDHFVALYGQEFSTISSGNHVNVFEVPEVITATNGKFQELWDWLHQANHHDSTGAVAIVQFNHPADFDDDTREYGRDDFGGVDEWKEKMGEVTHLIEVLNGPGLSPLNGQRPADVMERDYFDFLRLGFHVAPTGDQDNHFFTWGTETDARTGVIAPRLTKADVLQAMRARHVYATEDKNLRLIVRVNGSLCGDVAAPPAPDSELAISVSIHDDDEPNADYEIQAFRGTVGQEIHGPDKRVPATGSTRSRGCDTRAGRSSCW